MARSIQPRPGLVIAPSNWWFRASRAGGPGGQHVNTTSSRVELVFSVQDCQMLSAARKTRILESLAGRCNAAGELRLVTAANRSQLRNKEALVDRLEQLLADCLKPVRQRRKTKTPAASKRKRLDNKKHRSQVKRDRRRPTGD